jgi:hypothetical protein
MSLCGVDVRHGSLLPLLLCLFIVSMPHDFNFNVPAGTIQHASTCTSRLRSRLPTIVTSHFRTDATAMSLCGVDVRHGSLLPLLLCLFIVSMLNIWVNVKIRSKFSIVWRVSRLQLQRASRHNSTCQYVHISTEKPSLRRGCETR